MRIGIDLGGTKIEGIALGDGGEELARARVPTPAGDYRAIVEAVAGVVAELERLAGGTGSVGIGTPGAVSPASGRIKNSNTLVLNDRPLREDLEARLGRSVRLANDANCFALSEAVDGAAREARVVFGVIVGTGTGGGIVVDRKVLTGRNAVAGEWGHNPLPWAGEGEAPGPPCYCGKRGCIETFLSGPGLARDHERATGERLDPAGLVRRAGAGAPGAAATLGRYEDRMARALAHVINLVDPDAIVLGGGLCAIPSLYVSVPRLWGRWVFSDHVATSLVPPRHGASSGVRGAAWLWD